MSRIKSLLKAIAMTPWFVSTSWGYITTKSIRSKVDFFTQLIPAWIRFTYAIYNDFRYAE